ncbi:site-specific integrase [Dasania sp. GY-MA-18]|uniref:Site-specific integrase n=1 Tax=Dasania phycosphaerae TaxID=2950436 RepID=A0A9J6RNI4_9GAMM|nr:MULTISPECIES: site-specific integrase [Dasania]MCR8923473.1 site-specific integrase [Dasania sp. GY-MA-18]MCZ0865906.1 site-specific integrase [Dasania phycosphaerae]MCZ0869630.1 site-specific integrase [Dasania phycosphaerae]
MYKLIYTQEDYECRGVELPGLPFLIDEKGVPLDEFNQYMIYLATIKRRNIEKTIGGIAYSVKNMLNRIQRVERNKGFKWDRLTDSILILVRESLIKTGTDKKNDIKNETINEYISDFIGFLWWVENTAGLRSGMIGINDIGKSKRKYRIALEPGTGSRKYSIPFLLKSTAGNRGPKGDSIAWDNALDMVINHDIDGCDFKSIALNHRDEILIRLLRESTLRREEVVYLEVDQFQVTPRPGEKRVAITLKKTKIYKERDISIYVDGLWQDIQEYINTSLKVLLPKSKKGQPLIPSLKTGRRLEPNSINEILKKYGIRPHDGRALGLTERFIDLVEVGIGQQEALLIVSQEAGHSLNYDNKTLLKHYLRAQEIVKSTNKPPRSQLETENINLKRELALTQAKLEKVMVK